MYLAVLLVLVAVYFLAPCSAQRRGPRVLSSLALLGSLSVPYAWNTYDLPRGARRAR